jgi:asparagine synthase (glutamine-hydrolysing)
VARPSFRLFLSLLRHFGPGWLAFRAWHLAQAKIGLLKRRTPASRWEAYALDRVLAAGVPTDAEGYFRHRQANLPGFFFSTFGRRGQQRLFAAWDDGRESPISEAAEILKGTLRWFAVHKIKAGFPPDWHRNPFTGERLPADRHWSEIPDFAGGDIKAVWEPSRFGFAFCLVRSYWRTGDENLAEAFWRVFEDWCEKNPPNSGPNWKCGQEIALRVVACAFAFYGFQDSHATTAARAARMASFMAAYGRRIEANIGYALSQQNNHGMSEAVGLWTIGVLFPELSAAKRWEARGRLLLERLGRELIYEDGAFCQHSVVYHRLMLHLYLWALSLGRIHAKPFSLELQRRVEKAVQFLAQLVNTSDGRVPYYGQNDGALILPLNNCGYGDFRPAVQALHYLFTGRRCFPPGPWDEDLLWFFGPKALEAEVSPPEQSDLKSTAGGCFTLRDSTGFAFVRCQGYRHRPGQADQLHADIWWQGRSIALDAGTYSYNAPGPWDNALAGSRFHNTVTVDGLDQMERAGRFLWLPWARARDNGAGAILAPGIKVWEGEHDGYQRLVPAVSHRRAIVSLGNGFWLVLDRLCPSENRLYRLHWLLADEPQRWSPEHACLALQTPAGDYFVRVGTTAHAPEVSLVRADPDSPRGWQAPAYLYREPALSLALAVRGDRVLFWSLFGPQPCDIDCSDNRLSVVSQAFTAELRLQMDLGAPLIAAGNFQAVNPTIS